MRGGEGVGKLHLGVWEIVVRSARLECDRRQRSMEGVCGQGGQGSTSAMRRPGRRIGDEEAGRRVRRSGALGMRAGCEEALGSGEP